MNDEDIEILEEHLRFIKPFDNNSAYIPALENLIKGYKELEKYKRKHSLVKNNYIPKSKVREKIKELQEEYIQLFELERKDGEREIDCKIVIGEMEILEKLLQEGDK